MRTVISQSLFKSRNKTNEFTSELDFSFCFKRVDFAIEMRCFNTGSTKDAVEAGYCVKKIGCGISFKAEHFIPGEDVITSSVLHEIGITDSA